MCWVGLDCVTQSRVRSAIQRIEGVGPRKITWATQIIFTPTPTRGGDDGYLIECADLELRFVDFKSNDRRGP